MTEFDTQGMQEQELLKQIRDELRATRVGDDRIAGGAGRPTASSVMGQLNADRIMSGQWSTLGWSSAYRSQINTSLPEDLFAAMGLTRAPNTMTQLEYQANAASMLGNRTANLPLHLLAPSFLRQSDAMAGDLFAMSGRFARAGSPMAGAFGSGMSFAGAHHVARDMQLDAIRDLRMSGTDYSTVMRTGMESGQFDFVKTIDELKQKFHELKETTADLTRTTRMSVEEVSKTLGTLRQYGVVDVADQRRVMEQISATANVAGISSGEMSQSVQRAVMAGGALGLGAIPSAQLAMGNMAALRELSRAGIVSGAVVAAGGGVQGLEGSITGAQMQLAGSALGYYAHRGGPGGGFLNSLSRGISGAGSIGGIMQAEFERIDTLSGMTGARAERLQNSFMSEQLRMLGISDEDSPQAQAAVFSLARGTMGDAGATAYAKGFGGAGRRSRYGSRYAAMVDQQRASDVLEADTQYLNESVAGNVTRGLAEIKSWPVRALAHVGDSWSSGAGYIGEGSYYQELGLRRRGVGDVLTSRDLIQSYGSSGSGSTADLRYETRGVGGAIGGVIGGIGGTVAGAAVGGFVGVGAASMLAGGAVALGPLGWTVAGAGLLAGAAVGAYTGAGTVATIGGWIGSSTSNASVKDKGTFLQVANAYSGGGSSTAREVASNKNHAIFKNAKFRELLASTSGSRLDPTQTDAHVAVIADIAKNSGVDAGTVAALLKEGGASQLMATAYTAESSKTAADSLFAGVATGGTSWGFLGIRGDWMDDVNSEDSKILTTTAGRRAFLDLVDANKSGDTHAQFRAQKELSGLGMTAKGRRQALAGFRDTAGADDLAKEARASLGMQGSVTWNKRLAGVAGVVGEELDAMGEAGYGVAAAKAELAGTASDRRKMIELLTGDSALRTVISQSDSFLKDITKIDDSVYRRSNKDIADTYFRGDMAAAEDLRSAAGTDGKKFKEILAALVATSQTAAAGGPKDTEDTKRATILNNAATTMDALMKRLGINGPG